MIDGFTLALALLSLLGLIIVALIGGGITLAVQLAKWQNQNRLLWGYNRQLQDHIYRGSPPPPPPAPADLFD